MVIHGPTPCSPFPVAQAAPPASVRSSPYATAGEPRRRRFGPWQQGWLPGWPGRADDAHAAVLTVTSQPAGAAITIDGRDRGHTPASLGVAPGPHTVVLQASEVIPVRHTSTFERFPLRVLIGLTKGMADGLGERAFFFYNDRYIATDTPQLSASVSVVDQTPDTVTLGYVLYSSRDAVCCPSLGSARVCYRWNGSGLDALDQVPSADFLVTPHR